MNAVPVETPQAAARRLSARMLQSGYLAAGLHEYRDANGNPVFWRIRCKHPGTGDKWLRPMHWNGAGYVMGEPPKPDTGALLYRLPDLLVDLDATVWIVEGEACADALAKAGKVATTSGGASSADGADWEPLRARSVILWPDNDGPGRKYADTVATHLRALDCAVSVVNVAALNLPDGGDVVDWLKAGGGDLDTLPMLRESAAATEPAPDDDLPRVELMRGDSINPEPVDWLWGGWLAAGKLAILGGQPGTGKTTIATALGATVTMGGRWPDATRAERGDVIIWSGEDDPADTLVPRLRAAGADMARIHFVQGMREGSDRYPFDPARDTDALAAELAGIGNVRMMIIDPIVSAVAGDSHKNAEVRRGLQPLVDLAQRHRCALLGITHFTKGTAGREPVERITGSLAFGALARLVMVTAKADEKDGEPARRFLARAKSNIGPDGGGFVYDLLQDELPGFPGVQASRVLWGAALEGTARELLADAEQPDTPNTSREAAKDWLRELLAQSHGAMESDTIKTEAVEAGFSWATLRRAKDELGIKARKRGVSGGWAWELPPKMLTNPEDAHTKGVSAFGQVEHLRGEGSAEGCEGGAQNCPPSSEAEPPPSGDSVEEFDL